MIHGDSGDIYCGFWVNDKAHGKGTYYNYKTGAIYEGEWKCDKQEGFGTETWPNGTTYIGSFKQGLKHGLGKLTFLQNEERAEYEGDFYENQWDGRGTLLYP